MYLIIVFKKEVALDLILNGAIVKGTINYGY